MAKKKPKAEEKNKVSAERVAECISQIKAAWNKQVESIIATGKLLAQTKAELGHGRFTDIFNEGKLPFKQRTAECLMEIAKHPILSNPQHVAILPPHWGTLHRMAADIEEDQLEELLENGTINADTEREEIEKIIENHATGYEQGLEAIDVLLKFMKKYPEPSERATLVDLIMDLYEQRETKYDFSLDELDDLGSWIGKLRIACQTELDRYKAEHPEEFMETRSLFDIPAQKDTQRPAPEEELAEVS